METYTSLLLLCLLGVIQQPITATNTSNINPTLPVKANERFRRLIPYMTFYFAQQNYGNRPQYQEYSGVGQVLPVSDNKLSSVPQYQGNLVVPSTYLLRYTARPVPVQNPRLAQPVTNVRHEELAPRPFSPSGNVNILQNTRHPEPPPLQEYPTQSIKDFVNPQTVPQSNYDTARALTVSQILNILQAIRKLPQTVTPNNREQTMSQIINILQLTSQLPPETVNSLAKVLSQIPRYNKVYNSLTNPPPISNVNVNPKLIIYSNVNPNTANPLIQTYTNNYVTKLPVISTPTPNPTENIEDYEAYDDETKLQQPIQNSSPQIVPKPLAIISARLPLPVLTTTVPLAQNINDLQKYGYSSEAIDTSDNKKPIHITSNDNYSVKKPKTSTLIPDVGQNLDELQAYGYASKQPKHNYYRGHTTTQIFPHPTTEGGTPGRPGVDYPTYSKIPETGFSCKSQRYKGFFGDPETSCQVWHYCDLNGGQASFLCPNGTIFSQVGLTCDWWFNVRCSSTPQLYVLNERLYKYILPVAPSFPEDFSGPLVDQYLTLKFQELENKKNSKENTNKTEPATPNKS